MSINLLADWAQILSLFLAIIAVLVSFWIYRRSLQRRALTCWIDPIVFPIEVRGVGNELKIVYKGHDVKNLFIVRARIKNTGSLPIRRENVFEPLLFTFHSETEILRNPEIINKRPRNLQVDDDLAKAASSSKRNSVKVQFDLLNPEEEFTIEFLCTGTADVPSISTRIEGVNELELVDPTEVQLRRLTSSIKSDIKGILFFSLPVGLLSIFLMTLLGTIFSFNVDRVFKWIAGIFFVVIIIAMLFFITRPFRELSAYRKNKRDKTEK